MHRRFVLGGMVACLAAGLSGCGGGAKISTVTGSLTYQGKPLPNAQVNFAPVSGGQIASGQTDSNGRFRLGTMSIDDGALIGKHRVSVIARGPPRALRSGEVGSGMPGDMSPGEPLIPEKYFDPKTSGLEREVVRGSNDFPITLE